MKNKVPYVIQEHNARRAGLHWDFRFRYPNGKKLISWAIPSHRFPTNKSERILAARTEDHSLMWLKFQGQIESGYGAGKISIIERGKLQLLKFDEKHIIFKAENDVLNGVYILVKTRYGVRRKKNGQETWLLMRVRDDYEKQVE